MSRAEIELPADLDPHADAVYDRAAENFAALKRSALVVEDEASVYFYRLRMGEHQQLGLAACYSLDEYDHDAIKKHERTRRDKEDDRTHHMIALGAQTGPVFLTYRSSADVSDLATRITAGAPLFDVTAPDGVQHTIWLVTGSDCAALVAASSRVPALYIADGHHRAASAARARTEIKHGGEGSRSGRGRCVSQRRALGHLRGGPHRRKASDVGYRLTGGPLVVKVQ